MTPQLATKGEFAKAINVTPGRVSQYISEGKLGPDELEGVGRHAKIRVPQALAKLKLKIDAGQRLGNGLGTRLFTAPTVNGHAGEYDPPEVVAGPATVIRPAAIEPPPTNEIDRLDLELRQSKLEQQQLTTRKLREEEKARAGIYIRAEDAKAMSAKLAGMLLQMMEQGVADMAADIAREHGLPERDVRHLMGQKLRAMRQQVAERMAREAQGLPTTLEDE